MPPGTLYVGRPTVWGNPFTGGAITPADWHGPFAGVSVRDQAHAVRLLRSYLDWRAAQPAGWHSPRGPHYPWERQIRAALWGRDLACWCPMDTPCHADLLLTLANPTQERQ